MEKIIDIWNVVLQHRGYRIVTEEVLLGTNHSLGSPELKPLIAAVQVTVVATSNRYDPVVHVSMIPHKRGFEIVVIAMAMDGLNWWHLKQESRQSVQQVVVKEDCPEILAERESVGEGVHLQLVIGQRQVFQFVHPAYFSWDAVQAVVLERQEPHIGTLEELQVQGKG